MRLAGVLAVLAGSLLGTVSATAQQAPVESASQGVTGRTLSAEELEKLPPASRDFTDAINLLPGASHLGFNEEEQKLLSTFSVATDGAQAYAYGDDPTGTPVVDQPGTHVTYIGAAQMQYDSAQFNSFTEWPDNGTTTNDSIYFKSGDGPIVGEPFTLFWAVYERPYPVEDMGGIGTNRGFVTAFPGAPAWKSSFAGDTWDGGFRMPTIEYGPDPWSMNVYEFVPPQTFDTPSVDGFGVLTGNTLFLAVRTSDLVAGGYDIVDLRFGYHGHDSENRGPGYVTAYPPVPGREYGTFVPGFAGFPLMPGTLIMETPEPVTTTTTSSSTTTTSSTTTSSTTTTTMAESSPPTSIEITDSGSGTSYVGWWITGGLILFVGGGIFFVARWNDPCILLKARWMRAKKACEEARRRVEERRASLREAEQGLQEARDQFNEQDAEIDAQRRQLAALERARGTSITSGGVTFHRIPEGLLTSEGLESLISSVQKQIESHEQGMQYLRDSIAGWERIVGEQQQHVADAEAEAAAKCAAAEAAKKAYEDCIKAASTPAPTGGGETTTGGGSTIPPPAGTGGGSQPGGTGAGPEPGGTGPGVATGGDPEPEPQQPACEEGQTQEEELERKSFTVPATSGSLVISIDPPTEEFADWMAGRMAAAGGWFSPSHLNDAGFAGTVRSHLEGLDSGMAVSHTVRIEIPRREVTYACIQHWVCRGGQWVKAHRERREVGRKDLSPIVIEENGKTDSARVAQLIGQAQSRYRQLVREDDSISQFCP